MTGGKIIKGTKPDISNQKKLKMCFPYESEECYIHPIRDNILEKTDLCPEIPFSKVMVFWLAGYRAKTRDDSLFFATKRVHERSYTSVNRQTDTYELVGMLAGCIPLQVIAVCANGCN